MRRKICHLTFDMGIGGAERVIDHLVRFTDASVYDVSVICLDRPIGPLGLELQAEGYPVFSFNRRPGFDLSLLMELARHVRKNRLDVLHCHQYTPYVYGVLAGALTGARVIFTEHGRFFPDRRKLKRVLMNPLLNCFTEHIVSISSATRQALIRYENFPAKDIQVIYNGIPDRKAPAPEDTASLKRCLGIGPDAHILGTVARLDPIKNQRMMIKALKIVQKVFPETFLILVGDGPERDDLQTLSSQMNLSPYVVFTGYRGDVQHFLHLMDVFLLTSFSEGTAMTLLEAMSCGLPCIATAAGGNTEIVEDGRTGFLVPSDNEALLAERIITLLKNPALRVQMGREGRSRFQNLFSVKEMVLKYQELYGTQE